MATFTVRGYEDFFPTLAKMESDGCLTLSNIDSKIMLTLYDIDGNDVGPLANALYKHAGVCDFVVTLQGE